jgi:hypothetical protein
MTTSSATSPARRSTFGPRVPMTIGTGGNGPKPRRSFTKRKIEPS